MALEDKLSECPTWGHSRLSIQSSPRLSRVTSELPRLVLSWSAVPLRADGSSIRPNPRRFNIRLRRKRRTRLAISGGCDKLELLDFGGPMIDQRTAPYAAFEGETWVGCAGRNSEAYCSDPARVGWVELSRNPSSSQLQLMGIASLHPSYELLPAGHFRSTPISRRSQGYEF